MPVQPQKDLNEDQQQDEIIKILNQKRRTRNLLIQKSAVGSALSTYPDSNPAIAFPATRNMLRKPESQFTIKDMIDDYEFSQKINSGVKVTSDFLTGMGGILISGAGSTSQSPNGGIVSSLLGAGAKAGVSLLVNEQKADLYDLLENHARRVLANRVKNYVDRGGDVSDLYKEKVIAEADKYLGLDEVAEALEVNVPQGAKPILNEVMIGALKKAITGNYLEQFEKDAAQDDEIKKFASQAVAIQHAVNTRIDEVQGSLDDVKESIETIKGTIDDVKKRVEKNEGTLEEHDRDIRFLSDYMYGKMSPEEKLRAIKANIIKLPDAEKEKEIKKQNALAAQESLNASMGKLISNGQAMVNILDNVLGPDNELSKNLGKAVEVGNVAVSAYLQFQSGNVLGAISSVSNLMGGGRPDPAAARHAEIMKTLAKVMEKLDEMDKKLDQLIKGQEQLMQGQKIILDTLLEISDQIYKTQYEITSEILFNRKLIAQIFIDDLNRIEALYFHMGSRVIDVDNGIIPTYEKLCSILEPIDPDSVEWEAFKKFFQSKEVDSVHPILYARTHIDEAGAIDAEKGFKKASLQASVEQFNKQFSFFFKISKENFESLLLFALNPVATCGGIQRRIQLLEKAQPSSPYRAKLSDLASNLININFLKQCVDALCNTHFLYPIIAERRNGQLLSVEEFLGLEEWQIDSPTDWLYSAKKIVDIAILQQSIFMGDSFLPALYELLKGDLVQIENGSLTEGLFKVLEGNESILGFNLMLYAIPRRIQEVNGYDGISSYKFAYDQPDPTELHIILKTRPNGLKGQGTNFPQWDIVRKENAQGWWIKLGQAIIRLPNTEEIGHQRFAIPFSLALLQQLRTKITIQEQTYDIPKKLAAVDSADHKWEALIGCLCAEGLGVDKAPLLLP